MLQPIRPTVRATVVRHALLIGTAAVVLSGLVTLGVWLVARAEAHDTAARVSTQVASAVIVPLSELDYALPSHRIREELGEDLSPFLRSGMVHRVKVWRVEGDEARIVFSDEPRLEAERRRFDPELAVRLDSGEAVVLPVPDDSEHRFEADLSDELLEVFIGFHDASGNPARLEVYVPVDIDGATRNAMVVMLPLALVGLIFLGLAMLSLSVTLAGRIDRDRREQQDVLHYGLAASELARRDLAQRLHDDVIPDLAGVGLLLDAVVEGDGGAPTRTGELVGRARRMIGDDVRQLRQLLTELLPPEITGDDVPEAFERLVAGFRGQGPDVELGIDADLRLGNDAAVLLHRIAGELLRNATVHAAASRITVRLAAEQPGRALLEVADDGRGFDPDQPPGAGHIGLLLVRRVAEDVGGQVTITSAAGAGAVVTVGVPVVLRLPRPSRHLATQG